MGSGSSLNLTSILYTAISTKSIDRMYNVISVYLCKLCIDNSTYICYNVIVKMGLLIKAAPESEEFI